MPKLTALLAERFGNVVPMYFSGTREGGRVSRCVHGHHFVRLLAVFPRRPKLATPSSAPIGLTINGELIDFALRAENLGIPTVAALPLAQSLLALNRAELLWARMPVGSGGRGKLYFEIDPATKTAHSISSLGLSVLSDMELVGYFESVARRSGWADACQAVRELHRDHYHRSRSFFGPAYKPLYVAVFDHI